MVITRMRWKATNFNNNYNIDNYKKKNTEWYEVKSHYRPRKEEELIPFENGWVG